MPVRVLIRKCMDFPRKKACICLLLVYTFLCGSNLHDAVSKGMGVWEFVLYSITDHYYLVYAWLREASAYYGIAQEQVCYAMGIALLMRILEIHLLYFVDLAIYRCTNRTVISFFAPFFLYLPGILVEKNGIYFLGKGSAYQVAELFSEQRAPVIWVLVFVEVGVLWICGNIPWE